MPDNETPDTNGISRREAIGRGTASLAAVLLAPDALRRWHDGAVHPATAAARPYLDAALRAERWINRTAVAAEGGTTWPADPNDPKSLARSLYTGSPGVVLFYLELHAATGEARFLTQASAGAGHLLATLPSDAAALGGGGAGLYTGVAGTMYVLEMTRRATGDARYGTGVARATALLREALQPKGGGAEWNPSTDIISGSAGILLALTWLGDERRNWASWRADAVRAGDRLLEQGTPEHGGLKWGISDAVPRRYPNFSHGTAGVAYTLATLARDTEERRFLDGALAGHRYLSAIATTTSNNGLRVFHSEPGGEQLFYLSWCHGPAGTARLYRRLGEVTGDAQWGAYIPRLAQAIVDSGVPEVHPDRSGYWNNVSQCCGNCGVSEFFLDMHQLTGDARHLAFAQRVADDTIARATVDGDGLKWIQAENRIQPEVVIAQTGLMQGAAGVGLAMLHLDGRLQRRAPAITLPDAPSWG